MKFLKLITVAAVTIQLTSVAQAVNLNTSAPKGGTFNYNFDAEPESLHPIMGGDVYNQYFNNYVQDSMCANNFNTWAFDGRLAEKWEIGKDGLTFTFFLRKDAVFHDGSPVTADDVKFSLEAIREPKHQALNSIPYFEKISKVDVIDKHTVKFTASEKYFQNLNSLCGMAIIPKSVYGDVNKSVKMQKEAVGAGPYKLEKYDKGQMIVVKRNDKWYGWNVPHLKGMFNFDQINFRFTKDDNILVERLKKGDIDYAEIKSTDAYLKATGKPFKPKFTADKFVALAVKNDMPKSYGYIGFNFKDPILADKNVRLAFAHLVNRAEMNKKFAENLNHLATSPVPVGTAQSPDRKAIEFNPAKAKELLTKAGWTDADKNGVLEKTINGKKTELKLSFIYANKDSEKQWTIVKEDCKKAGIDIELKLLEWNTFIKNVDERQMQLWAMGWGGGDVEGDPKQIWHSSSASKGGSNYGTYANPEVDKLIDEGRQELDPKKRTAIFKKAYGLIADDVPYVFLFNRKYEYYGMSNKVKAPGDTFKYDFGFRAWWSATK
ncbi:ABC transporter substrate-binding protein [Pseudobdellovibrio sp. HCB154]|uniref:ABC transporter substrate-binding protein n=1 Tax=Pseudobdellovibrio sp. HCB154 TaxID=3386277 RepID=UPI0039176292